MKPPVLDADLDRIFSVPPVTEAPPTVNHYVFRVADPSDMPTIRAMYLQAGITLTDADAPENFVVMDRQQEGIIAVAGMQVNGDEGALLPPVLENQNYKAKLVQHFGGHASTVVSTLRIDLAVIGEWVLGNAEQYLKWWGFKRIGDEMVKRFEFPARPRKVLYDSAAEVHYGGTGWRARAIQRGR